MSNTPSPPPALPPGSGPEGRDVVTGILEDGRHVFGIGDFAFDGGSGALLSVLFTSVPSVGALYFDSDGDGSTAPDLVTAGQEISAADIAAGRLSFEPLPDGNGAGYAGFTFQVRDSAGGVDGGELDPTPASYAFDVAQVNDAPQVGGIGGDSVAYAEGAVPVRLDLGGDAAFSDLDNNGFEVARVGRDFLAPLYVGAVPDGGGRLFVATKLGQIYILDPASGAKSLFLDVGAELSLPGEQGLLGFAPAPDFADSGNFYIFLTNLAGDIEVRRYAVSTDDPNVADPSSADLVLRIPHPGVQNHNGGWLGFGPDGYLYVATGDGSEGGDANLNGQNIDSLLAKMLRIDVAADDFPDDPDRDYAIPADNPFVGIDGSDEIWAVGLRNPFRNSFDPVTGNLYIGDVGQALWEEINVMRPTDGGANFGWSILEGTQDYRGGDTTGLTAPTLVYGHGPGALTGNSVTGGYVYRGPVEALQGLYIFGDFIFGNIWAVPASDMEPGVTLPTSAFQLLKTGFAPDTGAISLISSFGTDEAGNLYILDYNDGEVYRVQPSSETNFGLGRLIVSISDGKVAAEDVLGIDVAGTGVTLSNGMAAGSQVRVGGILVGAISSGGTGQSGQDLVIAFSSGATPARVSTLVQALTYSNANQGNPVEGTRTISYTLVDGAGTANGGQDSAAFTTSVTVTGAPDAPELQAPSDAAVYVENAAPVLLLAGAALADPDAPASFDGGGFSLAVSGDPAGAAILLGPGSRFSEAGGDLLDALQGETIGTISGLGTLAVTVTLNEFATPEAVNALLLAFAFQVSGEMPATADRTATLTFDEGTITGAGLGASLVQTVRVLSVNDAPAMDLNGAADGTTSAAVYVENAAPVPLAPAALVTDADSADFGGGSLDVIATANAQAGDLLTIIDQGGGAGQIGFASGVVRYAGTVIGAAASISDGFLTVDFNEAATREAVEALLRAIGFSSTSDVPVVTARGFTFVLRDGDGIANGGVTAGFATASATITPVDDPPVSQPDAFGTDEAAILAANVTANDSDVDGPALIVVAVNGVATDVGQTILLPSGARLLLGEDGSLSYDPNDAFNHLPSAASGAVNFLTTDGFTYQLENGSVTEVTVSITGVASAEDFYLGDAGDNVVTGAPGSHIFDLSQGGQDSAFGNGGDDSFLLGASFGAADRIDGGLGVDRLVLEGDYGAGVSLTATSLVGVETLSLLPGFDYRFVSHDATVASGAVLTVLGEQLQAANSLYFDGGAESDGRFALFAGAGDDTLIGGAGDDQLSGGAGDDDLSGGDGNDLLDGGAGSDMLAGGAGDDRYFVGSAADQVTELLGEGSDIVYADASYTLGSAASVEILAARDQAGTASLTLIGNAFDQILYGNAGNNRLIGNGGHDTLIGFGGDDLYIVDGDDVVVEAVGAGFDAVGTHASYQLPVGAAIEVLATTNAPATAPLTLIGNEFAQTIYGNAGDNEIIGLGGADTLIGGLGDDTYIVDSDDLVVEGANGGFDTIGTHGSYQLFIGAPIEVLATTDEAGTGAFTLIGNEFDNTIYGNAGDNKLIGMGGADVLVGGLGNDFYVVDDAGDLVIEGGNGGNDTVAAHVSYALSGAFEVELLATTNEAGTAAIDLTGNLHANTIYGNAGGNVIDGGGGNDVLVGLGGADTYAFTTALGIGNVDRVIGFETGVDNISLDNAVFTGLATGALAPGAFRTGTSAQDADDRILYDSASGALYFDADGNGAGAAIQFATLAPALNLSASDFAVI